MLAVADGTVFSVGWNDVGGYRLWLRDRAGNQFYYAHLSAFSPLAVNGRQVKAGDVLGFVGNTGDAETTPYHLHFEIHPVGLLYLGYDGAVNPYPYLMAWQRLAGRRLRAGRGLGAAGLADDAAPRSRARSCSRDATSRPPTASTRARSSERLKQPRSVDRGEPSGCSASRTGRSRPVRDVAQRAVPDRAATSRCPAGTRTPRLRRRPSPSASGASPAPSPG